MRVSITINYRDSIRTETHFIRTSQMFPYTFSWLSGISRRRLFPSTKVVIFRKSYGIGKAAPNDITCSKRYKQTSERTIGQAPGSDIK